MANDGDGGGGGELRKKSGKRKRHNKIKKNETKNALNIYAWFLLHEYVKE